VERLCTTLTQSRVVRVVLGLQGELGPHHSRHNSGSIKVSSALDDVVPALERIIAEVSSLSC
jgi:hypothetical protein